MKEEDIGARNNQKDHKIDVLSLFVSARFYRRTRKEILSTNEQKETNDDGRNNSKQDFGAKLIGSFLSRFWMAQRAPFISLLRQN